VVERRRGQLAGTDVNPKGGRPPKRPTHVTLPSEVSRETLSRWRDVARHWRRLWPLVRDATAVRVGWLVTGAGRGLERGVQRALAMRMIDLNGPVPTVVLPPSGTQGLPPPGTDGNGARQGASRGSTGVGACVSQRGGLFVWRMGRLGVLVLAPGNDRTQDQERGETRFNGLGRQHQGQHGFQERAPHPLHANKDNHVLRVPEGEGAR